MSARFKTDASTSWVKVLICALLAELLAWIPILIGGLVAHKLVKHEAWVLLLACLSWGISDVAYTLLSVQFIGAQRLVDGNFNEPIMLFAHAIGTLLMGTVVIFGLALYSQARRQVVARQESVANHESLIQKADEYVATISKRFSDEIARNLEPGLARIKREVEEISSKGSELPNFESFARRVRNFSTSKVRALSHRISETETELNIPVAPKLSEKIGFGSRARMLEVTPPPPLLTAAFYICFDLLMRPNARFVTFLLTGAVVWSVLTCASLVFRTVPKTFARTRALVTICSHIFLPFVVISLRDMLDEHVNILVFCLGSLCATILIALMNASYRSNLETAALLLEADSRLASLTLKIRNEAEALRESFWQVLHGKIQGRLALVSLTLGQLSEQPAGSQTSKQLVTRLQTLLDGIESDLQDLKSQKVGTANLSTMVADLAKEWKGLLKINVFIAELAGFSLEGSSQLQRQLVQLVEEAILNARIHGAASEVWVEITRSAELPVAITLKVIDDGSGFDSPIVNGLGTRYVAAICNSWSLTRDLAQRTTLAATMLVPS